MEDRPDILNGLTNIEIIRRYRLDRDGIQYLETLRTGIQPHTYSHNSLSFREKLLITFRNLATGEIQLNVGDIHHAGPVYCVKSDISGYYRTQFSSKYMQMFIRFAVNAADLDRQVQQFHGIAGFPKVVGVINGTHVRIQPPSEEEDAFVNRKGFYSINTQVVFNAFDEITDVVVRWPGLSHGSRILDNSGLKQMLERGSRPAVYHMLKDSGCRF